MLVGQFIEHRVNTSQVFLENIIYNVPQYILWKDRNSVFLGCNHNFARLVGLEFPEDIIGKTDYDLGWRSEDGYTADYIRARDVDVLEGKQIINLEQYISLPDGNKIVLLTNKVPVLDERNEIMGILVVATDITDRKRDEQKLLEAKLQAELSDQAKSEFIANISHDLRTPINSILGVGQILNMRERTKEQKVLINDLNTSANLLLSLVEDILDFTRLEVGRLEARYSQFNLRRLVDFVVKTFHHQVNQKRISINVHYASSSDYIISEPNYVRRIFLNLVSNAVKFTEKGDINVFIDFVEGNGTLLKISVKDSGIGIPNDKLNTIFDRFGRVAPVYTNAYEGLGLGLSIVKRLTTNLGGEIHVVSQENKGSVFTISIPCEIAPSQPRITSKMRSHRLNEKQKLKTLKRCRVRVLLVEDDTLSQNVEKTLLEEFGCIVDVASNGEEALAKLKNNNNNYELIYMDIGLPDRDGYTLAREIRRLEGDKNPIPIVAMTAHVLDREKNKCLEAGMDGFVNKPVTTEEIKRVLLDYIF